MKVVLKENLISSYFALQSEPSDGSSRTARELSTSSNSFATAKALYVLSP